MEVGLGGCWRLWCSAEVGALLQDAQELQTKDRVCATNAKSKVVSIGAHIGLLNHCSVEVCHGNIGIVFDAHVFEMLVTDRHRW